MRRLISRLLDSLHRTRIRAADQHITDLENMLSGLLTARDNLDAEITETTRRLMIANQARATLGNGRDCQHTTLTSRTAA